MRHKHQTTEELKREAAPDTDPETAESPDSGDPISALAGERDQLAAAKAELEDRLLRTQAEFQNYRKRADKERLEFTEYASTEAVRALLPIIDDFERALKTECADQEFAKGIALIYQRMLDSLKKLGLEPIESTGQPFDPNLHHAVDKAETTEFPEDTVLAEYQRGYNFKSRLLRPAMVKVAVAPAQSEEQSGENE